MALPACRCTQAQDWCTCLAAPSSQEGEEDDGSENAEQQEKGDSLTPAQYKAQNRMELQVRQSVCKCACCCCCADNCRAGAVAERMGGLAWRPCKPGAHPGLPRSASCEPRAAAQAGEQGNSEGQGTALRHLMAALPVSALRRATLRHWHFHAQMEPGSFSLLNKFRESRCLRVQTFVRACVLACECVSVLSIVLVRARGTLCIY